MKHSSLNNSFTFIDLFAGIGGVRIAFENAGGECVFSSEMDKYARKTYSENFGVLPFGDIRQFTNDSISDSVLNDIIPDHDVLCAGFPCQPFSTAGGLRGFKDSTSGTLFFDIERVLASKKPKAFFMENVKNLVAHDKGKTFSAMSAVFDRLGYEWRYRIVDSSEWVPQRRERVFIVGFLPGICSDFEIPEKPTHGHKRPLLRDIVKNKAEERYTIGAKTWEALKKHKKHHSMLGHGFGYSLIPVDIPDNYVTKTITARYYKDGSEILIDRLGKRPRKVTISEAMQLQGFPKDEFNFPVSNTQAYKQIGNSVAIPAVEDTAKAILKKLKEGKEL